MDYLAVAAAGFLGAVTRGLLNKIISAYFPGLFPFGILIINLTGCLFLSLFMNLTLSRYPINPRLRLAVGTGFVGAYTTFSTFAVGSIDLLRKGFPNVGILYILATSFGCVAFAWLGKILSDYITEGRPDRGMEGEN